MDNYTTEEIIPGYMGTNEQSDLDYLNFHRWLYGISYKRINARIKSDISYVNKSIWLYKKFFDIDVTKEMLYEKKHLIIRADYDIHYIIDNRDTVLTLINYDVKILDRIACIYNYNTCVLVTHILFNVYMNERLSDIEFNFIKGKYHQYISNEEPNVEIPDYIEGITIPANNLRLNSIPEYITSLLIISVREYYNKPKKLEIPKTVIHLMVDDLSNYILHDDITHLSYTYNNDETKLPKNLIALRCQTIDNIELPASLKNLYLMEYIDVKYLPEDIESLECTYIMETNRILKKLKYLKVNTWNCHPYIFPNLEILIVRKVESRNISQLKHLKIHGTHEWDYDLPERLLYFRYNSCKKPDYKFPDSIRVLDTIAIPKKYEHITTLMSHEVKQEHISNNLVILYTSIIDLTLKDDVLLYVRTKKVDEVDFVNHVEINRRTMFEE